MNNSINSNFPQENLNKELLRAINSNDLDYMKYLLTSPELKVHADPTYNDNRCFEIACGSGRLEVVKYLINTPEVKFKISRKALITQGIHFSVCHNRVEILDYFRNEARVKTKLIDQELRKENFTILERACSFGFLEIVEYIFKNPKVEGNVFNNSEENINRLFEECIYNGNSNLIRYFIFEHDTPKSESLQKLLKDITGPERRQIEGFFELRETNKSLHKELVSNEPDRIKSLKL
jgi:hypothetical protein